MVENQYVASAFRYGGLLSFNGLCTNPVVTISWKADRRSHCCNPCNSQCLYGRYIFAGGKAARFGMLGAGFGLGFVLGPLIGGLLGEWGPRAPFFAAAMLAAANGVLCYFVLKKV